MQNQSIPLWQQLKATSSSLTSVRRGATGKTILLNIDPGLRPGVQSLFFEVMRNLGRAEALRNLLVKRISREATDALLCTALALVWKEDTGTYDDFTLVNQAVEATKKTKDSQKDADFVNACLRRFLREKTQFIKMTDSVLEARWNHPIWWIKRLQDEWPEEWESILMANNRHPPMALRVNIRKNTVKQYQETLSELGISSKISGSAGLELMTPCSVQKLPGFEKGWVSVQDSAAQIAANLLLEGWERQGGIDVLDACAAPGGKTAHLLESADLNVIALDIDPERCKKVSQTLARLDLLGTVVSANAGDLESWWDGKLFDAILLDAPCSASGIVRRHPDVRWLRKESDIAKLASIQADLLDKLWRTLKISGRFLFCTCSVFKSEGEYQTTHFLKTHIDARLLTSPGHILPRDNNICNTTPDYDGFYYALFEKSAN